MQKRIYDHFVILVFASLVRGVLFVFFQPHLITRSQIGLLICWALFTALKFGAKVLRAISSPKIRLSPSQYSKHKIETQILLERENSFEARKRVWEITLAAGIAFGGVLSYSQLYFERIPVDVGVVIANFFSCVIYMSAFRIIDTLATLISLSILTQKIGVREK